jgi:hypothetical protein
LRPACDVIGMFEYGRILAPVPAVVDYQKVFNLEKLSDVFVAWDPFRSLTEA